MDARGWRAVTPFVIQQQIKYPILLGNPATARAYGGIAILPHTFFIDREGRVAGEFSAALDGVRLRQILDLLLQEKQKPPNPAGTGRWAPPE